MRLGCICIASMLCSVRYSDMCYKLENTMICMEYAATRFREMIARPESVFGRLMCPRQALSDSVPCT
jgi:hypothetical protein